MTAASQRLRPAQLHDGFTVAEFMAMAEAGAFDDFVGKIELLEGVIVRMAPAQNPHFHYQRLVFRALDAIYGDGIDGYIVGQEPTVDLSKNSCVDPDIAILRERGPVRDINHAPDMRLAVEISDSTLRKDMGQKKRLYARAAVPTYWVVDINRRLTHRMTEPEGDDYREAAKVPFGEPLPVPGTNRTITIG